MRRIKKIFQSVLLLGLMGTSSAFRVIRASSPLNLAVKPAQDVKSVVEDCRERIRVVKGKENLLRSSAHKKEYRGQIEDLDNFFAKEYQELTVLSQNSNKQAKFQGTAAVFNSNCKKFTDGISLYLQTHSPDLGAKKPSLRARAQEKVSHSGKNLREKASNLREKAKKIPDKINKLREKLPNPFRAKVSLQR